MGKWKSMYQCDTCGHISGWKYDQVCGGCGETKEKEYSNGYKGWSNVAARWVSDSKWWNPSTWHSGRWKSKEE